MIIEKAEKLLQEILLCYPYNLSAFLLLIPVMQELKRSDSSIATYVNKITILYNDHPTIKAYCKAYCRVSNTKQNIKKKKSITKVNTKSLLIHQQLATKTMYALFVKQKKYHDAYAILETMKQNNKNIKFVKQELPKISQKIKNN